MMSVLGPLSIDPNMLNTQRQQVQVRHPSLWRWISSVVAQSRDSSCVSVTVFSQNDFIAIFRSSAILEVMESQLKMQAEQKHVKDALHLRMKLVFFYSGTAIFKKLKPSVSDGGLQFLPLPIQFFSFSLRTRSSKLYNLL